MSLTAIRWGFVAKHFFIGAAIIVAAPLALSQDYTLIRGNGTSMAPTFQSGEVIVVKKSDEPHRGQLIGFDGPEEWMKFADPKQLKGNEHPSFMKRIEAVAGDTVAWDGRTWSANGVPFSTVATGSCGRAPMQVVLEEGQYFVAGDNNATSLDSRRTFCYGSSFLVEEEEVQFVGTAVKVLGDKPAPATNTAAVSAVVRHAPAPTAYLTWADVE